MGINKKFQQVLNSLPVSKEIKKELVLRINELVDDLKGGGGGGESEEATKVCILTEDGLQLDITDRFNDNDEFDLHGASIGRYRCVVAFTKNDYIPDWNQFMSDGTINDNVICHTMAYQYNPNTANMSEISHIVNINGVKRVTIFWSGEAS